MDQRHQFALESLHPAVNMSELCASYGISRRTGYKWKERFLEEGLQGLLDQSRRLEVAGRGHAFSSCWH